MEKSLLKKAGLFIALEGLDGSGTTTQAKALKEWLDQQNITNHLTCEPSEGPIGLVLRKVLKGEVKTDPAAVALLFAADRVDHIYREVKNARENSQIVICDRYVYSSLAYQSIEHSLNWVRSINTEAPEPTLTIYLRVAPEVAKKRRNTRDEADELFDDLQQQKKICQRYDELLGEKESDGSWVYQNGQWLLGKKHVESCIGGKAIIDAEGSFDEVQQKIRSLAETLLKGKCANA